MADGLGGIKPLVWIQGRLADHVFKPPNLTQFCVPESFGGRPSFIALPDNHSEFSVQQQKSFADHIVDCFSSSGTGRTIKRQWKLSQSYRDSELVYSLPPASACHLYYRFQATGIHVLIAIHPYILPVAIPACRQILRPSSSSSCAGLEWRSLVAPLLWRLCTVSLLAPR